MYDRKSMDAVSHSAPHASRIISSDARLVSGLVSSRLAEQLNVIPLLWRDHGALSLRQLQILAVLRWSCRMLNLVRSVPSSRVLPPSFR